MRLKKQEVKTIHCVTCPFCKTVVTAIIKDKKIHCPKCFASANYEE